MAIKKVTNADSGTADIVGGDDWDAVSDILNLGYTSAQPLKLINPAGTFTGTIQNPDFLSNTNVEPFYSFPRYIVYQDSRDNKFKVKSGRRGTIDGDYTNAEDAINFAIDLGPRTHLQFRDGDYTLSGGFTGFHDLQSHMRLDFAQGARIYVPNGYTGYVFNLKETTSRTYNVSITGGIFDETTGGGVAKDWTWLKMTSLDNTKPLLFNNFRNCYIGNVGTAISLNTTGTGWINGNVFDNLIVDGGENVAVFTHTSTFTANQSGCNRNRFENILYQTVASSQYGYKDVNGKDNEFNGCMVWDLTANNAAGISMNITANASFTKINGGMVTADNFADLGTDTMIDDHTIGLTRLNARFSSYTDVKTISAPSSPATGYNRLYAKAIDSNNNGLFAKEKVNGAVVEVQYS